MVDVHLLHPRVNDWVAAAVARVAAAVARDGTVGRRRRLGDAERLGAWRRRPVQPGRAGDAGQMRVLGLMRRDLVRRGDGVMHRAVRRRPDAAAAHGAARRVVLRRAGDVVVVVVVAGGLLALVKVVERVVVVISVMSLMSRRGRGLVCRTIIILNVISLRIFFRWWKFRIGCISRCRRVHQKRTHDH